MFRERHQLPFGALAVADVVSDGDHPVAETGDRNFELADASVLVELKLAPQRIRRLRDLRVRVEQAVGAVRGIELEKPSPDDLVRTATERAQRRSVAVLVSEVRDAAGLVTHRT